MSYTRKLCLETDDAPLEIFNFSSLNLSLDGHVLAAGTEAKVAGHVAAVVVSPVQLKLWLVPTRKRDKVREKLCAIFNPRRMNADTAPTVVRIGGAFGVCASNDDGADAVKESSPMLVVGANADVSFLLPARFHSLAPSASSTAR
jgi:hypothetical protein